MSEVVVQRADILWTHSKDIANTNMLLDFQMRAEQLHLGVEEAAMRAVFLLRGIGKKQEAVLSIDTRKKNSIVLYQRERRKTPC